MSVILDNVSVFYNRNPAVSHVCGRFEHGSLTAITGANGAGKSTLLKAIAGILKPQQGTITVDGTLAYLPQASEMQRDFPLSVLSMVLTGFWPQTRGIKAIPTSMQGQAMKRLEDVGLAGFEKRDLASLSTGQFQRALFARLLVQNADIMLLDEPFSAIDETTVSTLMQCILRWHKEGRTILCVLHDNAQIRQYFPQTLLLARECVSWRATVA